MTHIRIIPLFPMFLILVIVGFSLFMLYSVCGGNSNHWVIKQFYRFVIGCVVLLVSMNIPLRIWYKSVYIIYVLCIICLIAVNIIGTLSMGAKRWLTIGGINAQPSEIMRISLIFVMARYFSERSIEMIRTNRTLIEPIAVLLLPVALVLLQPDLGTAMLLTITFMSILFICGVQVWKFVVTGIGFLISMPIIWNCLYDYQRQRILMFLNPELDPSGSGYHIIQSKIALGSGGIFGKGFMNGTQSQLNFLPETRTDFIFAALGEEFGFIGCCILIALYVLLLTYNFSVAVNAKTKFNRILAFGLNSMIFFYIVINISMVCGLLPVVGIPLPFFSYGGSSLIVLMFCQGLIFSIDYETKNKL